VEPELGTGQISELELKVGTGPLSTVGPRTETDPKSHFIQVPLLPFIGLAYQGNDVVFRFIIEYNRLRDSGP